MTHMAHYRTIQPAIFRDNTRGVLDPVTHPDVAFACAPIEAFRATKDKSKGAQALREGIAYSQRFLALMTQNTSYVPTSTENLQQVNRVPNLKEIDIDSSYSIYISCNCS